jgi:L-threonylcarbamoyladenylate synthase
MTEKIWDNENLINVLGGGGVAVMPTDTIYGVVGRAQDISTVERIYKLKKRAPKKPCIILISDMSELDKFSIILSGEQKKVLQKYWPGSVSIILDCAEEKFSYLHRGTKTLAFRLPAQESLQNLLKKTGPLIAPSANPEGLPPARNINEAKNYFGDNIDLYVDGGQIENKASKLIRLNKDGTADILRD